MHNQTGQDPMLDMYIFEMTQMIEQLEQIIIRCEQSACYNQTAINEIFRMMHTIKGSSAMMQYNDITSLAHSIEDIFYFLREAKPKDINFSKLTDLILSGIDFIKIEVEKVKNNITEMGTAERLVSSCKDYLASLKNSSDLPMRKEQMDLMKTVSDPAQLASSSDTATENHRFKVHIHFSDGCEMENIRAFAIIHNLAGLSQEITYLPMELLEEEAAGIIKQEGFHIQFRTTLNYEKVYHFFDKTSFVCDFSLSEQEDSSGDNEQVFSSYDKALDSSSLEKEVNLQVNKEETVLNTGNQSIISVNIGKLNKLMDLVGEMVIAEAILIQNPDLKGLVLNNFNKAARELNKITDEIQDIVISIRMIPLTTTFQKMNRIVRDMSRKLGKDVKLEIVGENTEVDKNVIEHISDPLMHLVRNSLDHGIESPEVRQKSNKEAYGTIILEARHTGSDVVIMVKDDGRGLNKEQIIEKAKTQGLLTKDPEEMTEKEVYSLIMLPGFSTKDKVTEYSGRGVGLDVVAKNIDMIGGSISIDSSETEGTSISMKIPLTLAIIDGMNLRVGQSFFTVPTNTIKEAFRSRNEDLITTPDGSELLMVRGQCYPLIKLYEYFNIMSDHKILDRGIVIKVEANDRIVCILADEMLGMQSIVVKALPKIMQRIYRSRYLAGCTLLGDGSISLILDVSKLLHVG